MNNRIFDRNMNYKVQRIPLEKLSINTGQIEGLPANPRQWTREDINTIAASLKETPELFELRPIIAVPFKDTNVILAGSLRFCGARENGDKDAPTILLPADIPVAKMKEIVIKDNGAFGAWDFDALANEWDDLPLGDWGVPVWKAEPIDEEDEIKEHEDLSDKIAEEYKIEITCGNEAEQEVLYNELATRGLKCRLLTL